MGDCCGTDNTEGGETTESKKELPPGGENKGKENSGGDKEKSGSEIAEEDLVSNLDDGPDLGDFGPPDLNAPDAPDLDMNEGG